ncbi:MAG TPA: hypothetical protein VMO88_02810 [Acidimicrobiales bacterium]|nr:hypothetical protein [Acidimicrobiales bacterium]
MGDREAKGDPRRSAYELAHSASSRTARPVGPPSSRRPPEECPTTRRTSSKSAWRFARQLSAERRVDHEVEQAFGRGAMPDMLFLIGADQNVCGELNAVEIPAPSDPLTGLPGR